MVGNHIRAELQRPLEGPRHFVHEQRGPYLLRMAPEHVAESVVAIRRRELLSNIAAFRRILLRRSNLGAVQDLT